MESTLEKKCGIFLWEEIDILCSSGNEKFGVWGFFYKYIQNKYESFVIDSTFFIHDLS